MSSRSTFSTPARPPTVGREAYGPIKAPSNTGSNSGPTKIARDYQMTDMTDELSLGTFCHENGHLIGDFPDLYDKRPPSNRRGSASSA